MSVVETYDLGGRAIFTSWQALRHKPLERVGAWVKRIKVKVTRYVSFGITKQFDKSS